MKAEIYEAFDAFLQSQSNIGHFKRKREWDSLKERKLEEIFECQEHIKDEIIHYIKFYYPGFLNNDLFVLDIGCSLGALAFAFKDIAKVVVGIDIEEEAITCARLYKDYKNYKNIEFFVDNAITCKNIKTLEIKFNLVLLKDVVEHMEKKENFELMIKNILYLLSEKSLIYIETPNYIFPFEPHLKIPIFPLSPKGLIKLQAKILGKIRDRRDEFFLNHLNIISPFYILKVLNSYGFRCVNPVEDIKIEEIFSRKKTLSERYKFIEPFIEISSRLKLGGVIKNIIKLFKLYPTFQLLCFRAVRK